jgi:hypothetical protein
MQIETAKKYVVEVYSDKGPLEASPWAKIGEFSSHSEAVDACKQIVDKALDQKRGFELDAQSLINYYLNFGDVPFINGVENIATFDLYAYLANRCSELAAGNRLPLSAVLYGHSQ